MLSAETQRPSIDGPEEFAPTAIDQTPTRPAPSRWRGGSATGGWTRDE